MAALTTIAAVASIASAVVGVVGAVGAKKEAKRARAEQERANRIQNKQAARKRQENIRRSLAQARIARANVVSGGFGAGIGTGGSVVAGATGAIGTDFAGNVGASGEQFGSQVAAGGAISSANAAIGRGNQIQAFTQAGQSALGIFSDEQNLRGIQGLFS